jgi:predicted phosphodiesterase
MALFETKPPRTFERIEAGADCDVLVFGHTHQPWIREYGGVLFVNCGSVGKRKDCSSSRATVWRRTSSECSTTHFSRSSRSAPRGPPRQQTRGESDQP